MRHTMREEKYQILQVIEGKNLKKDVFEKEIKNVLIMYFMELFQNFNRYRNLHTISDVPPRQKSLS